MKVEVKGTLFFGTTCVPGDYVVLESDAENKINPKAIKVMHVPRRWEPETHSHSFPFENEMVGYVADDQVDDVHSSGIVDSNTKCVCVLGKVDRFWIDTSVNNPCDILL